jgi:hypothetical protein
MLDQHVQSIKKGGGNVYAIIGKDGWKQSINHVSQSEYWTSLWCKPFHLSFLFVAHVENVHAFIKFAPKKDVFVCDYVVAIKIC